MECKDQETMLMSYIDNVLIETLWNVKSGSFAVFSGALRINRNIVECKDALQAQLANCCWY